MGRAKAIVLVTHNTALIRNICTKALWLDRGQVAAFGSPDEVLDRYAAAYRTSTDTNTLDESVMSYGDEDQPLGDE
jgi:lipopolysaccharide transport system ATP-binding protein